jgi:hypothetical protein
LFTELVVDGRLGDLGFAGARGAAGDVAVASDGAPALSGTSWLLS